MAQPTADPSTMGETARVSSLSDPDPDQTSSILSYKRMAREMGVSDSYERKVALLNKAIKEEIGFGKFQIWLTFLAGFGWFIDNVWFEALAISLPQINLEFRPRHIQFATLALYIGLFFGATFWGVAADVIGRRPSWNITLFISAVFGIAIGGANNFVTFGALLSCLGLGVGGNLPVDGAMLIEFVPGTHQWILTGLSIFWSFGQLFAALVGWALIPNFRCESATDCPRASNMGWRYTWFTLGGLTFLLWVLRFFVYPIPESPKFLIAKGRDAEAIAVIQFLAKENGKTTSLTLEQLVAAGLGYTEENFGAEKEDEEVARGPSIISATDEEKAMARRKVEEEKRTKQRRVDEDSSTIVPAAEQGLKKQTPRLRERAELLQLRKSLEHFDASHLKALFASPRMIWNTVLVCFLWGLIGLAYPLYNAFVALYLANAGANYGSNSQYEQYKQLVIIAACGIPGSVMAAFMVELPYAGRRGSMAFFTMLTGVFLFLFTTARTPSAILGWNCATSLTQNAMYAVLYAITYEVFPTPHRGTGDGLAMGTQRVFGVIAPVVGAFAGSEPTKPIYVSASFFIAAAVLMLMLPYEPRGKTAL
ncbi:MFS general substrate transporter [Violaceomyces palustris]|uniref:MFS general substrate transporter n=1 Tax=Violaceomyces palustris TaxID=1673888 RepID=A0ACD0P414_9BASI|nr:MFS general substrate transporter [Violaceomyces palustris]